jgi:protein-L-isoaspartate O-methyltransferase
MKKLIELGIITAITENLLQREDFDHKKKGVLEIDCGTGELAAALKDAGITRYHGFSRSEDQIEKAKKSLPKGYAKKLHVADTSTEEVLSKPHDIIICAQGSCPYDVIPSGQRLIVVTRGERSWGACCLKLAPHFAEGAKTVQHGDLFLTIGEKA